MPIVLNPSTATTVGDLVSRVFRDWLHAPEDQPVLVSLDGDVTSTSDTWTYDDATLAPDEEDLLAPGVLVECGTDQRRITAVDYETNTLTVTPKAVNGTTAAAHEAGDQITVAPTYGRQTVVDAVCDQIVNLYPSLWHVDTHEFTTASSYVEVPAEVITPTTLWVQHGDNWSQYQHPHLLSDFPPSATGKAIQTRGVPCGVTAHLVYYAKFVRPTSEDDQVSDFGVDASWERIVVVGAAASVVGQRPADRLTAEYITEQLEREALPPGSATDIRNGLLTLRDLWLREARRSIGAERGTAVVYNRLTAGR